MNIKNIICTVTGIIGALITQLLGGWTGAMTTLVIFMGLDYITGLIVVKTSSGICLLSQYFLPLYV
ncbi:MAG: phage holin family protein [Candidatus Ornithomonoglobus sp.]